MSRVRRHGVELTMELESCLKLGPAPLWDDFTDEDLEIGWRIHGAEIMEGWELRGDRPWGWWRYEQGEDPPPLQPGAEEIRLAEIGELTEEEYAALAKRAAEARAQLDSGIQFYVATGQGRRINFEEEAIERWQRVQEARKR